MNLLSSSILLLFLVYFLHMVTSFPVLQEDEIEERRRKNQRKRRPCTRNNEDSGRWFFGHDLTLFLGDVTICGGYPTNTASSSHSPGLYEGVVPSVFPHKPHRPHKPHKPHRPIFGNQENNGVKPVEENVEEDFLQDEYYKPGPLVGVLNNNVMGQEQNLSNLNNYTPTRIINTLSRHFNRIVNPFIDLFYR